MDEFLNKPISKESDILGGVTGIFAAPWTLTKPTFDLKEKGCSVTWYLKNTNTKEVVNLTITRFTTTGNARKEYTETAKRFTADTGIALSNDLTNAPDELKRLWAGFANYSYVLDPVGVLLWTHYNFLIEMCDNNNPQGLVPFAGQIGALVDKAYGAAAPTPKLTVNQKNAVELPLSYAVGNTFEVTVNEGDQAVIDLQFVGTSVLYLSASRKADGFTFKFLCRAATPNNQWDIIKFSTFDPSLANPESNAIYVEIV